MKVVYHTANDEHSSALEEIANSISHGIGFIAVLAAASFLFLTAAHRHNNHGVGIAIFVAALALLYLASTLYHALPQGRIKELFLKLDYSAIFLVIAATYTAFAHLLPGSIWSWRLLMVWSIAGLGLLLKLFDRLSPLHSTLYYVAMGWLTLIAAMPLAEHMPHASVFWMIVGGLVYTWGVVFYLLGTRLRFSHLGWHVMVMLGSGCHFIALIQY